MFNKILSTLLLSTAIFANEVPQSVIDTGEKVSRSLLKQLGPKLKHEIKTNGIISAAKFCNENTYILTEEINLHQLAGVKVKRISLKERNPANSPSEEEKKVLESMHAMLKTKTLPPYLITQSGNDYKYYKPLIIKKQVCLKCHGDISQNSELSTFIKDAYPLDKATGYSLNDLRGAILVDIKH